MHRIHYIDTEKWKILHENLRIYSIFTKIKYFSQFLMQYFHVFCIFEL